MKRVVIEIVVQETYEIGKDFGDRLTEIIAKSNFQFNSISFTTSHDGRQTANIVYIE